jgi:hypothetical protein
MCGRARAQAAFNDEHVLPDWLLRKYELHSQKIVLPNGKGFPYGSYTIPCCEACNAKLGRTIEQPIRDILVEGRAATTRYLDQGGTLDVFRWLALIFLKTHLKDRALRLNVDLRLSGEPIASAYEWEQMHHIHSVVRSLIQPVIIREGVVGTLLHLPMVVESPEPFDFADLYEAQTAMLRLGDQAFVVVFGDAGISEAYFDKKRTLLCGNLNALQLREVMAEVASLNMHLRERPHFKSAVDLRMEEHQILCDFPKDLSISWDPALKGELLHYLIGQLKNPPHLNGYNQEEGMALIRQGKLTFLFDNEGCFIPGERGQPSQ